MSCTEDAVCHAQRAEYMPCTGDGVYVMQRGWSICHAQGTEYVMHSGRTDYMSCTGDEVYAMHSERSICHARRGEYMSGNIS
jgi:hypothetical protein